MDAILHWNQVALDAVRSDFTPGNKDEKPEQGGPTRTSRALAIIHLAMYDAHAGLNGIPTYLNYSAAELPPAVNAGATASAVSAAACMTLLALYARQRTATLAAHEAFLSGLIARDPEIEQGLVWGRLVAARMLAERTADGSDVSDAYSPSTAPGRHRVDPVNPEQGFLGVQWGKVKPFAINNLTNRIAARPPNPLNSPGYATDYVEVLEKGRAQGSTRTPKETTIGIFWAYDGASGIGVPPRLFNQFARAAALDKSRNETQNARLFAMINAAMADAGIYAWYEKFLYNLWRPVVGIREADAFWGPSGGGDGNGGTTGDPFWVPLGSPPTNQPAKAAFTPNFPAHPSGHATFGTAAFRVVERELGLTEADKIRFVSDELDGKAVGSTGVRPRYERSMSINAAIQENLDSRVFLGVHWRQDSVEGERIGNEIAQLVSAHFPSRA